MDHTDWDDYFVQPNFDYTDKLPATDHDGEITQFCAGTYGFPYGGGGDLLGRATAMGGIIAAEHDGDELCGIAPETYTVSSNFLFPRRHALRVPRNV